ncbi:MAG TPA: hypothetical protein VF457_12635, partial [Burkholderiaceae bacterium]
DLADHGHGDHSSNPAAQKSSKGRLNTRVKFRSAEPSEVGQFSVGANMSRLGGISVPSGAFKKPSRLK